MQGNHSDVIKINKKVCQAPLVVKESLANVVYNSRDQLGEGTLEMTINHIGKLCEKYLWL